CHDHVPYLTAERRMHEVIEAGQWKECLDATNDVMKAFGRSVSMPLRVGLMCLANMDHPSGPSDAERRIYVRVLHEAMGLYLAENAFRPNGITEVRTEILEAIASLEQAGAADYANDLRQQLASAVVPPVSASPPVPPAPTTFSGTAFVVNPNGYLLTAFHVVE